MCLFLEAIPALSQSQSEAPRETVSAIPTAGAVVNNCFVPLRCLVLKSLQVKSSGVWAENGLGVPGFQWHGAGPVSYVAI